MFSIKSDKTQDYIKDIINPPRFKRMLELVDKYKSSDNFRLLEYGGGDGTATELLQKKFPSSEIIIADIDDYRKVMKQNKFIKIDPNCSTLDLEDGSIDMIFTSEVLEHVYNLTLTMKEFHRVLKKDGVIVMSTPNFNHFKVKINHFLFGKIDRLGGTMGDGGHRNFITQEFFRHFIKGYFEILEESGDIDLLPVSNLLPGMQRLLKHRYYLYRENNKLNPLSYQYIRVIKKI